MPDSEEFYRFATDQAPELVRLAAAVTGDLADAERIAEEALVETFRSWTRSTRQGALVTARRAVVAACPRQRAVLRRPDRSLQLRDVLPSSPQPSSVDTVNLDARIRQAVGDLNRRHRMVLALRYGAGLTLADTARALKLPAWAADRRQQQALTELRLGADLDAVPPEHEESATAALAASVRAAFAAQIGDPNLDAGTLVDRVRARTVGLSQRSVRSPALAVAIAVAVIASVAAVAFLVQRDRARLADQSAAAPESQLVGYRDLAVAVPADWQLHESPCGRTVAPGSKAPDRTTAECGIANGISSVTFTTDLFDPLGPMSRLPRATGQVAGYAVLTTAVTHEHGVFKQTVLVPRARFVMTVRSPDQRLVAAITDSVRAVPDGFTVVPVCETLPVRDAVAVLTHVGLTSSIAHTSSLSARYGEPPVTFQDKPAGSIVRTGTAVALTIPSF